MGTGGLGHIHKVEGERNQQEKDGSYVLNPSTILHQYLLRCLNWI